MNRETALAGGALALLAVVVLSVLLVPGLANERAEDVRPSETDLRSDAPPAVVGVDGDTVTLQVDTRVVHRGGPAENVTLELRAVDAETGLLADRVVRSVGTLRADREERVLTNLSLAREGGYRIETILYENGSRLESGSREIGGVGSLTPAYAQSSIQFQRFDGQGADLPTITYGIENASGDVARLRVAAALTNTGAERTGDVTLRLRARQAESNVIADTAEIDVASIRPGRTASPTGTLSVPDGYNYWLDATIVSDGVVVGAATAPANLNPQETLEPNQTVREIEFEAGDFEREEGDGPVEEPDRAPATEGAGPGFGLAATLLAVLAALAIATRRRITP